MKISTTFLVLIFSQSAFCASTGHVSTQGGKLRVDYSSKGATSEGLRDLVTLLQKEEALESVVPNGSGNIFIYEVKTSSPDLRIGGVIYQDENGKHTTDKLKIGAPLSDEIYASYGNEQSFLSLKGQVAAVLFELCKNHGTAGVSSAIRYDFGNIVCNKDRGTAAVSCSIFKL